MVNLRVKQKLVGTLLGRVGEHFRQLWDVWRTMRSNPEQFATMGQELCVRQLLPSMCRPSTVFMDVGAHIGSVIADILRHDRSIRIIAIEADPDKATALARRFPTVEVHSCAVGETNGEATFYVDHLRPGFSKLAAASDGAKDGRAITVRLRRLDELVSTALHVEVMKIDVEGGELGALRGASDLIARCRPAIMFESGPNLGPAMGYTHEALFDWFEQTGYELFVPNRLAHDGPPLHRDGFLECHFYPFRTLNYFAVPAERRIEIRDRARNAFGIEGAKKVSGTAR